MVYIDLKSMAASIKKQIPKNLLDLISAGISSNHRSFLIIVGPHGTDRIPTINTLLQKKMSTNTKVLWCYHRELHISSNREKRNRQLKQKTQNGTLNEDLATELDLFFANSKQVTFAKYSESHRVLGQTFNMLVLQDFSSLTPNILARTVETVSGGGLIVLLLDDMQSLNDLYTVTMDYQRGMNRDAFGKVASRFNARFHNSLKSCSNCIAMTDEFDLLDSVTPNFKPDTTVSEDSELHTIIEQYTNDVDAMNQRLSEITDEKQRKQVEHERDEKQQILSIVEKSLTADQAKTVGKVIDAIKDRQLGKVVGITAARGRGKSAAIGLSLAAALALGYSNIFVTAPSIANLTALFEFVIVGLNALGFREGEAEDYEVVKSNPTSSKERPYVTRVNVHLSHGRRQTVQYVRPNMTQYLGQCEILAIDEAAAIPLPVVRQLMGPYTTLFSSTVDGYEGTGRALSLKLFKEFQKTMKTRFSQTTLQRPIRYSEGDPIEVWLHNLLLLDVHPQECSLIPALSDTELVLINRDALFNGSRGSEELLRALISLSVESHYKNTPNDLTLMADSPNHRIFALINMKTLTGKGIPEIIAFLQVALEGRIGDEQFSNAENGKGRRDGDLIPWNIARAFEEPEFAQLTGVRIIRIAVNPEMQKKGYGTVAIEKLVQYYSGRDVTENKVTPNAKTLMYPLSAVSPEPVDYIGVSFGLTRDLAHFWRKSGFVPLYVSRETNEVTGEHSVIVVKPLADTEWLPRFTAEFKSNVYRLMPTIFKDVMPFVVEEILFPLPQSEKDSDGKSRLTDIDVKKLSRWSGDGIGAIKHLLESVCDFIFIDNPPVKLTRTELFAILIMGKQMADEEECAKRLEIQVNQVVALLKSAIGKLSRYLNKQRGDRDSSMNAKIIEKE